MQKLNEEKKKHCFKKKKNNKKEKKLIKIQLRTVFLKRDLARRSILHVRNHNSLSELLSSNETANERC